MNSPQIQKTDADGQLFKLATRARHTFGSRTRVMPHESKSGHEQHEWACQCCPMVKITVLPQGRAPYRAYRFADGCQFEDSHEPGCAAVVTTGGKRP